MAEWLKAHAWKACLGETLTWVRIALSPADLSYQSLNSHCASCRFARVRCKRAWCALVRSGSRWMAAAAEEDAWDVVSFSVVSVVESAAAHRPARASISTRAVSG